MIKSYLASHLLDFWKSVLRGSMIVFNSNFIHVLSVLKAMSALVEESPTAPAAPEVTGNVKLISKDGEEFVVSKNIASLSELISDSIMGKFIIMTIFAN